MTACPIYCKGKGSCKGSPHVLLALRMFCMSLLNSMLHHCLCRGQQGKFVSHRRVAANLVLRGRSSQSTRLLCRCRFGFAPIMSEWTACEQHFVLINNLGFAFLRRISRDKAIFEAMGTVDPRRQADSVCTIWNLLCESLKIISVYAL